MFLNNTTSIQNTDAIFFKSNDNKIKRQLIKKTFLDEMVSIRYGFDSIHTFKN